MNKVYWPDDFAELVKKIPHKDMSLSQKDVFNHCMDVFKDFLIKRAEMPSQHKRLQEMIQNEVFIILTSLMIKISSNIKS